MKSHYLNERGKEEQLSVIPTQSGISDSQQWPKPFNLEKGKKKINNNTGNSWLFCSCLVYSAILENFIQPTGDGGKKQDYAFTSEASLFPCGLMYSQSQARW